jgi:transcriptional regulator with XRE-family HTH domain
MAPKQLLPLIQQLKDWRKQNGFSQYEASRVLRDAGIPVTTDSLQAWEIGRWSPRAHVALALAEFLQRQPKRRRGKRSTGQGGVSPTKVRKVPQDSGQLPGRKGVSAILELPRRDLVQSVSFGGLIPTES